MACSVALNFEHYSHASVQFNNAD